MSASAVVIHYEEALYQVYGPFTFMYIHQPSTTTICAHSQCLKCYDCFALLKQLRLKTPAFLSTLVTTRYTASVILGVVFGLEVPGTGLVNLGFGLCAAAWTPCGLQTRKSALWSNAQDHQPTSLRFRFRRVCTDNFRPSRESFLAEWFHEIILCSLLETLKCNDHNWLQLTELPGDKMAIIVINQQNQL